MKLGQNADFWLSFIHITDFIHITELDYFIAPTLITGKFVKTIQ